MDDNMTMKPLMPIIILSLLVACGDAQSSTSTGAARAHAKPADLVAAKAKFDTFCFTCHGASGKGDGPASAALDPKPRTFTDSEWQKSVTDEQLEQVIVGGGVAVGKSPFMPQSVDLRGQPVTVAGLIQIIRDFGKERAQ